MRTKFLSSIARLVTKYPWWVLSIAVVLTVASIFLATTRLELNTDQDDLLSEKIEYHKRYKDYLREFGDVEYIYVVVEAADDLNRAKEFVKALAARIEKIKDVREVIYKISNPALEKGFLLYLPKDQLEAIAAYLPNVSQVKNLSSFFGVMNKMSATDPRTELETGFRFLDSLLDRMRLALQGGAYKPFIQQAFFGDNAYDEDGFLISKNFLFLLIMPEKNYKTLSVIEEPLSKIRAALDETRREFPDINPALSNGVNAGPSTELVLSEHQRVEGLRAGITGRPVLQADEMATTNRDMRIATLAAILIVTLLFVAYFKRPTRPIMAVLALICGISQTFGFATLAIGYMNLLTSVFAVILIGAGIEFGLQIVSRYREELEHSRNVTRAIHKSITETGKGSTTAALTTAAAFLAMCLTNFKALNELGLIAGVGIILCLLNLFTVLPSMMYIADRKKSDEKLVTTILVRLDRLERFYRWPRIILIVIVAATILLLPYLRRLEFDHNLIDLQAPGLESVIYEKKLLAETGESTWYTPIIVNSLDEVAPVAERLKALPNVGKVETIYDVVPAGQEEKIKIISDLRLRIADLGTRIGANGGTRINANKETRIGANGGTRIGANIVGEGLSPLPSKGRRSPLPDLIAELNRFRSNIDHLTEMAFSSGESEAVTALEEVGAKVDELVDALYMPLAKDRISRFERDFLSDLNKHLSLLKTGLNPAPIDLNAMPKSIWRRFLSTQIYANEKTQINANKDDLPTPSSDTGIGLLIPNSPLPKEARYAVYAYPKKDIWDPDAMKAFVNDVRTVDPNATGVAVEVFESSKLLVKSFKMAAGLALLFTVIIVFADFRKFRLGLVALAPLALGVTWLLELMGIFGIKFNLANFFGIPILLGVGVDNAVQIVHRFVLEHHSPRIVTKSTGTAVLLTSLTTLASFGTLAFASHRGIASLGLIMSIGVITCLIGSMVVLPCLLRLIGREWGGSP